jgi:AraC-like DNA-binding protein
MKNYTYRIYHPIEPLRPYIQTIEVNEIPGIWTHFKQKFVPDGNPSLSLSFAGTYQIYSLDEQLVSKQGPKSHVIGQLEYPFIHEYLDAASFVFVRFKSAGLYPFLGIPLSHLHNRAVGLDALWGRKLPEMEERVWSAPTPEQKALTLQRCLLAQLREVETPSSQVLVDHVCRRIVQERGDLRMRSLADEMGLSLKQLERLFLRHVGMMPKRYARIQRFAAARRQLQRLRDQRRPPRYAELAVQMGYSDQSHFIREFWEFSGQTPADYATRP